MFGSRTARIRRARLVPIALTTAALSSAVLGASVTGTLSAFNASITNSENTATTGSLVMKETGPDGQTTCLSSAGTNNSYASCSTINKYGGTASPFTPGTSRTTSVTIANTGSTNVTSFVLRPDVCTKTDLGGTTNSGDLCQSLHLTLSCVKGNGSPVFILTDLSLTAVASAGTQTIPTACVPGTGGTNPVRFDFALSLPSNADSTVQSQQVSQPLTWTFTGA